MEQSHAPGAYLVTVWGYSVLGLEEDTETPARARATRIEVVLPPFLSGSALVRFHRLLLAGHSARASARAIGPLAQQAVRQAMVLDSAAVLRCQGGDYDEAGLLQQLLSEMRRLGRAHLSERASADARAIAWDGLYRWSQAKSLTAGKNNRASNEAIASTMRALQHLGSQLGSVPSVDLSARG